MVANLKPLDFPLPQPLQQEFLIVATRPGHSLTGTETTLERAFAVARGLAVGGWRVRVSSCDVFIEDRVVVDVWAEDAPDGEPL